MTHFHSWRACAALACLAISAGQDTTPPTLSVIDVQAFIYHLMVTVQLNEPGNAYCGAVLTSGTYTPSVFQLRTNFDLRGHGSTTVTTANAHVNVIVATLVPSTLYDVFCYAEDLMLNGMSLSDIANTRQAAVSTASGGDYVAPTFSYIPPTYILGSVEMTVHVKLNEDGKVWCVAKMDSGSGVTTPTSNEIVNNLNVDAWNTAPIHARHDYSATLQLTGLLEDTLYDVWCFAEDMSGNFLDNTPAFDPDPSLIEATRLTGLRTLDVYRASRLQVTGSSPVIEYEIKPASWNILASSCSPRTVKNSHARRCGAEMESWSTPSEYLGMKVVSQISHPSAGCAGRIPPAPAHGGPYLLLLRRGKCLLSTKASRTQAAGYDGLLVVDQQLVRHHGVLPDMTSEGHDQSLIPSWIIGKTDGETLHASAASIVGYLLLDVKDLHKKPKLGHLQSDQFGLRVYVTK